MGTSVNGGITFGEIGLNVLALCISEGVDDMGDCGRDLQMIQACRRSDNGFDVVLAMRLLIGGGVEVPD